MTNFHLFRHSVGWLPIIKIPFAPAPCQSALSQVPLYSVRPSVSVVFRVQFRQSVRDRGEGQERTGHKRTVEGSASTFVVAVGMVMDM